MSAGNDSIPSSLSHLGAKSQGFLNSGSEPPESASSRPTAGKLDPVPKYEVPVKAGVPKPGLGSLVQSSSSENLISVAKPSKASEPRPTQAISVTGAALNPNATASTPNNASVASTSKSHPTVKKKKDTPLDGTGSQKLEHTISSNPSILQEAMRAMSPPKDSRRKSAKTFSRSSSSLSTDSSAVSKESTLPTLPSSTASSNSIPQSAPESTSTINGVNLQISSNSVSTLLPEDHPKKKANSKKRKSVKDIIPSHVIDYERDTSPSTRILDDRVSSSSTELSTSSIGTQPSHSQSSISLNSPSDSETITSEQHTPVIPKMRKSTSSTFKDSIVSILTSPIKKKRAKGEESDGERDDKVVSRSELNSDASRDAKDSKDKDRSDGKEGKDGKETKEGKDKDRDGKEAKEKDKELSEKSKSTKDRDVKEKEKEKDAAKEGKESKENREGKDSKEKDPLPSSKSALGTSSDLHHTHHHHAPTNGTSSGHSNANGMNVPSQSQSAVVSASTPLTSSVSFAKKNKKLKKKVGAGASATGKRKPKICLLQTIPLEVLLKVLCCLDVPSLVHMGTTSKLFKGICKESFVWHVVAVKMMRAGQRKPRIFEWQSYCKSIWCFRRGLSLDVELSLEQPLSQELIDSVEGANKRLARSFFVPLPKNRPLNAHPNGYGDDAHHPSSETFHASPSNRSSSSSMATSNGPEIQQKDGINGLEHASNEEKTEEGSLIQTSVPSASASHPIGPISQTMPSLEDQSDLTASTATTTDTTSTSEEAGDRNGFMASAQPSGGQTSLSPTKTGSLLQTSASMSCANVSLQSAVAQSLPAGLDVYASLLLGIIRTSHLDLQTDLSLRYPFLFTEDDGLELRLCVTLTVLFKVKQTLGSVPHLVLRANHIPTRETVVIVKIPYIPGMRPLLKSQDLQLTRFLRKMDCPFLVGYYGCYFDGRYIWYLSEHCSGGSCRQHLDGTKLAAFTEGEMAWMLRDVLRGLVVLHKHGFVHGNISASALMLTELRQGRSMVKLRVKTLLNALEASRNISSGQLARKVYWRAPENQISTAMDIWSIGITFIELAEGKPPGWNLPPQKARNSIVNGPPPSLRYPTSFSVKFRSFLDSCLAKDPLNRPTALQLLSHPFIVDNIANMTIAKKSTLQPSARAKLTRFNSSPIAPTARGSAIVSSSSRAAAATSSSSSSNAPSSSADPSSSSSSANIGVSRNGDTPRRTRKALPTPGTKTDSNPSASSTTGPSLDNPSSASTRRNRPKKAKNTATTNAKATSSPGGGGSGGGTGAGTGGGVPRPNRTPKITRRLSYAGSASTSDTMTHPYLSDSEDNISFALTHSSSRLSFSWSEDWASGSIDFSMDSSKH